MAGDFRTLAPFIIQLAGVGKLECGPDVTKPPQAASQCDARVFEVYVSLKGLIDPAAETKRLEKQLADKRKQLQGAQAKLENANFVKNAPPEIVQQQHDQMPSCKSRSRRSRATSKICAEVIAAHEHVNRKLAAWLTMD